MICSEQIKHAQEGKRDEEELQTDPAANVWPPAPTNTLLLSQYLPEDGIEAFPRQNVFLVLVFILFSLGIYGVVWLSKQAERIQNVRPEESSDSTFLTVVLVFVIGNAGLDIASSLAGSPAVAMVSKVLDRISEILVLFLTFQVRRRIHTLLGPLQNSPYRYSALGIFFFGILYLQYKINRNLALWQ